MKDKWQKLRKEERNLRLIGYAVLHPKVSLAEVGRVFHISGTRVRKIIIDNTGLNRYD